MESSCCSRHPDPAMVFHPALSASLNSSGAAAGRTTRALRPPGRACCQRRHYTHDAGGAFSEPKRACCQGQWCTHSTQSGSFGYQHPDAKLEARVYRQRRSGSHILRWLCNFRFVQVQSCAVCQHDTDQLWLSALIAIPVRQCRCTRHGFTLYARVWQ